MVFEDQLGRKVDIPNPPKRIISLVPSQTEYLHDLGLDEEVIGLTKFCIHPEGWRKKKQVIGGTKDFKIDLIRSLAPDLVIANKEENTLEGIQAIEEFCPVWVSDISDLDSALDMMLAIGPIVDRREEATVIVDEIRAEFDSLNLVSQIKAIYLIWQKPYMAAGNDTFIHHMLSSSGFKNLIDQPRYPELSLVEIKSLKPEVVLLSSEPFPFKEKHQKELEEHLNCNVELVDGEMFSWYGSRMLKAVIYLKNKMGKLQQLPLS